MEHKELNFNFRLRIPQPEIRFRWHSLARRRLPTPGNVLFTLLVVAGLL